MAESQTASLMDRFNRMWRAIDRLYHEVARRSGLSDCAFWIMYGLAEAGEPILQRDLPQGLSYSRQTLASALQQLQRHGLIDVTLAEGSRRDKAVRLTAEGEDFVEREVAPVAAAERRSLAVMGTAEADRLIALMDRYTELLDQEIGRMPGHGAGTAGMAEAPGTVRVAGIPGTPGASRASGTGDR